MRRILHLAVILLYGGVAFRLLRSASPVFVDGGGPSPSFYWGRIPAPTLVEYYAQRSHYDFKFLLPYLLAALIVTIIGCGVAPLIVVSIR